MFLKLVKMFPRLDTLSVHWVVSSAALILAVTVNPGLMNLKIRENLITFTCDINLSEYVQLSDLQKSVIREGCVSKETLESSISKLIGRSWHLFECDAYFEWMRSRYTPYFGELMV